MAIKFYGLQTARDMDATSPALEGLDYTAVIFGLRELSHHKQEFEGLNKDKVVVFVTSQRAVVSSYELGFRRVFFVHALNSVTAETVADTKETPLSVLEENYSFCKLASIQGHFDEVIDAVSGIGELIRSIKDKDPELCMSILASKGPILVSNAESIRRLTEMAASMSRIDSIIAELNSYREKAATTEEQPKSAISSEKASELATLVTQLRVEKSNLKTEVLNLESKIESLESEISMYKTTIAASKDANVKQFSELSLALDNAKQQLNSALIEKNLSADELVATKSVIEGLTINLQESTSQYQDIAQKYNDLLGTLTKLKTVYEEESLELQRLRANSAGLSGNEMIQKLKQQLEEMSKGSSTNIALKNMMPIIGPSFAVRAKHVVVFREVKHAIYMNAFLKHLDACCNNAIKRRTGKSYLILVLDMLQNDYEVFKYRKKGFALNTSPVVTGAETAHIAVINKFDVAFLKDTMRLNDYDYLFVVDRLGLTVPSVRSTEMTEFFMIDSLADIQDFDLKNKNLIAFGESSKTALEISVTPDKKNFDSDLEQRVFLFYKNSCIDKILRKAGIT